VGDHRNDHGWGEQQARDKVIRAAAVLADARNRSVTRASLHPKARPGRQPSLRLHAVQVGSVFRVGKPRCWPEHQSEQVVEAERRSDLTMAAPRPPCRDRGGRFRPKPHRCNCRCVGSVTIARMHASLVLHRPIEARIQGPKCDLQPPVLRRFGTLGVEPEYIDVTRRRRRHAAVQMVPDRIPDKARPNPAIAQSQGMDQAERAPSQRILRQDHAKRCSVVDHRQEIAASPGFPQPRRTAIVRPVFHFRSAGTFSGKRGREEHTDSSAVAELSPHALPGETAYAARHEQHHTHGLGRRAAR
jgi:hypothetical protein